MSAEGEGRALQYQLEMLKAEVEVVNATIRQMDEISKSLKEWAITVWAGSLGGALATPNLTQYVWATAAIPLLFWLVDSYHHVVQRKFIWRSLDHGLLERRSATEVFAQGRIVDFVVMDVGNRRDRGNPDMQRFTAWSRVLMFRTQSLLYLGLAVVNVVVALFYRG